MKFLLIFAIILTGCYTQQKAIQEVNKADDHFPQVVAKLARDKYPCNDILRPDTAVIFRDSTIYVDCPETPSNDFATGYRVDTVKLHDSIIRYIKVPVHIQLPTQVITKWYEDSAKLKIAAVLTNDLNAKLTKSETLLSIANNKAGARMKIIIGLLLLVIALLVWTFRKLFTL